MEIEITHPFSQATRFKCSPSTPVVPQNHHFQTLRRHGNGCFTWPTVIAKIIQLFVATQQKTCQSVFKRTKENCLATCLFMLLSFMGYHDSNIGPCITALGNATLEMHGAQHSSNTGLDVMCFYFPLSKTLNCYTSNQELLISSLLTFKN